MKALFFSSLLLVGNWALAMQTAGPGAPQEFKFHFEMAKDTYDYSTKAATFEAAYEHAAMACFQHYKNGRHVSEDQGLDIIDVCANPKKS